MKTVDLQYLALFSILLVVTITGAGLYSRLLTVLRSRHSEVWKALGSPTLIVNNTLRNSLHMWRFVYGGGYRKLEDQDVDRLVTWLRLLGYGSLVLWLALVSLRVP